jgi:hypothetical protein
MPSHQTLCVGPSNYEKEPCTKDWLAPGTKEVKGQSARSKRREDTAPEHMENSCKPLHALANHSTTRERAGRTWQWTWRQDLRSTAPQPDDLPQPLMLFFLSLHYFLYLNLTC